MRAQAARRRLHGQARAPGANAFQGSSGSAARAASASTGSTSASSGEIELWERLPPPGSLRPEAVGRGGQPGGPPPRSFDRPMKNSISTRAMPTIETRS